MRKNQECAGARWLIGGRHGLGFVRPGRGLLSLYDSDKWEFPRWDRSTEKSWKRQRRFQFKEV